MELLKALLTLTVVAVCIADVRAKLKGDDCEGMERGMY